MAFRYKLTHHPVAAEDFQRAKTYFEGIDVDLAALFQTDFRAALRASLLGGLPVTFMQKATKSAG